jgi:hypothetical protein
VVDLTPLSVDPTLPLKTEVQVVDTVQSLVNSTLPLESELDIAQFILVTLYFFEQGGIFPIPT